VSHDEAQAAGEIERWAEISMSERFVAEHGEDWRYSPERGMWLRWTGTVWAWDRKRAIFSVLKNLVRRVALESIDDAKRAAALCSAQHVWAVERLAQIDRRMAILLSDLDKDPWVLNTPGGVVDLQSGTIRPNSPDDLCSKITGVAPSEPAERSELWSRFLNVATQGDQDLEQFLQRMAGYATTGVTEEHALFFIYGDGGNGKGVFQRAISRALGDYATSAPIETFTEARNDRHPTELADLVGARLVTASETEEGRAWAEARIKKVTGGDPIKARFMNKDFFEYTPQFKPIFDGNHLPNLRNVGAAERRRFHVVPFTAVIPADRKDPELDEKLKAELGHVLRWMIDGCAEWQGRGLNPPRRVVESTDEYFEDQDLLSTWLSETFDLRPESYELSASVFQRWKDYAEANNVRPGAQLALTKKLSKRPGIRSGQDPSRKHRVVWGLSFRRGD